MDASNSSKRSSERWEWRNIECGSDSVILIRRNVGDASRWDDAEAACRSAASALSIE